MTSPVPEATAGGEHPVRVGHLDGIRALAILAVVSFHWNKGILPGLFRGGSVGVDMFLTLSGFLITSILLRRRGTRALNGFARFIHARVRRLYPALVGMVVLVVVVTLVAPGTHADPLRPSVGSIAVTLGQVSWIAVTGNWSSHAQLLIHTWTLAVEWTFYAVWPWILWRYLADRPRAWAYVAGGSAVVWLVCAAVLPWQWFYASPLARAAQLGVGCALALYVHERGPGRAFERLGASAAGVIAALSVAFVGYWTLLGPRAGASYEWAVFAIVPLATVGLIVGGFRSPLAARALSLPVLRGIGLASYSVYLWHVPLVLLLGHEVIGTSRGVSALLVLASTVVMSTLSYWYLERPYFRKRRPASELVDASSA